MRNEFTAIIERDGRLVHRLLSGNSRRQRPGADHRGMPASLAEAIALILEDRREDGLRGVPTDAIRETVTVG